MSVLDGPSTQSLKRDWFLHRRKVSRCEQWRSFSSWCLWRWRWPTCQLSPRCTTSARTGSPWGPTAGATGPSTGLHRSEVNIGAVYLQTLMRAGSRCLLTARLKHLQRTHAELIRRFSLIYKINWSIGALDKFNLTSNWTVMRMYPFGA